MEKFNCSNNEQSLFWNTHIISDPWLKLQALISAFVVVVKS